MLVVQIYKNGQLNLFNANLIQNCFKAHEENELLEG